MFDLDAPTLPPHMSANLCSSRVERDMTDATRIAAPCIALGSAHRGFSGRILAIHVDQGAHGLSASDLESRLLELGFVEGAAVRVLHEGPFGRDPIAVRINDATIALRRREAM